jgi:glutamate-1-semialdehyde aminotransferase
MNIYKSKQLFERAQQSIPGGVNSPVRAFKSVGGTPVFIQKAKGAYLYDADGNKYIDYINSWGPMILGHAYEPLVKAIQEKVLDSTSFGAPTELEIEMAEMIKAMCPEYRPRANGEQWNRSLHERNPLWREVILGKINLSSSKDVITGMPTLFW